jgi:hypothetical protein
MQVHDGELPRARQLARTGKTDPGRSLPARSRKYRRLSARSARHDHGPRCSPQPLPRRHSIFQRNDSHWTLTEQLAGKQSPTQLGHALQQLGIQQIPAYSPQAKGRIERAWRTCQDRLVSELRLAQTTTLSQANAVLARFCADYNLRFARPPADAASDFRRLPRRFDLARCLSLRATSGSWPPITPTLGAQSIPLPPLPAHRGYAGETVELSHQLDGGLRVFRGDTLLTALPFAFEEHAQRRPVQLTSAQKRKPTMPRIYNLSGRPALAAVT